ncbi:hypothetical protein Hypma_003376 [Hypsizygus marmoreus]|uniref:Uncharacterized protein n=1 Tax=Hypsizygus marmoreus TaxID=39966 RepID=A0A369J298_HYPMA|nr:hypothetical protein Hypma_003376 [Hypsizygus marmoreus]
MPWAPPTRTNTMHVSRSAGPSDELATELPPPSPDQNLAAASRKGKERDLVPRVETETSILALDSSHVQRTIGPDRRQRSSRSLRFSASPLKAAETRRSRSGYPYDRKPQTRKINSQPFFTVWYESRGPARISAPPPARPSDDIHDGTLFVHQVAGAAAPQMWISMLQDELVTWEEVMVGDERLMGAKVYRLSLTKQDHPSWVLGNSFRRGGRDSGLDTPMSSSTQSESSSIQ